MTVTCQPSWVFSAWMPTGKNFWIVSKFVVAWSGSSVAV